MTELPPLRDRTIGAYVDRLGSSAPDPGGGSVAGLVGALAAALGQMVVSLTPGNESLHSIHQELQTAIDQLLAASGDDERAYAGYIVASRLPRVTPEEKAARRTAMQAAVITSANVPLDLARVAAGVLDLLEPVVREGTTRALSDVEIAVVLAEAAVLAGLANVRINIPMIKDTAVAASIRARADAVEEDAHARAAHLRDALLNRGEA